jgi:UDP-GlcNAc:undecaprenyl-phosphate GlcNAc-1-phosphate transferase
MHVPAWVLPGTALVAAVSFVLSTLLTPAVTRLAHRFKWYDIPNWRKLHTDLIPRIGGVAIALAAAGGLVLGVTAVRALGVALPLAATTLAPVAAGILLAQAVGLWDDFTPLRGRVKFAGQILAATVVALGINVSSIALPYLGRVDLGVAAVPLTVLWIVGITNAFNLIDGMDGLSGGIAAFAAAGMAIIALLQGQLLMALTALAVLGAVVGFLLFNWPPASIIMGDSGSHFLGFVLAVIPLLGISGAASLGTFVVPITLLLIPVADCTAAIVRRLYQRRSILAADKSHIHHKLLALGVPVRKLLLAVYAVCAYLALVSIATTAASWDNEIYLILTVWAGVFLTYGGLSYVEALRARRRRAHDVGKRQA